MIFLKNPGKVLEVLTFLSKCWHYFKSPLKCEHLCQQKQFLSNFYFFNTFTSFIILNWDVLLKVFIIKSQNYIFFIFYPRHINKQKFTTFTECIIYYSQICLPRNVTEVKSPRSTNSKKNRINYSKLSFEHDVNIWASKMKNFCVFIELDIF